MTKKNINLHDKPTQTTKTQNTTDLVKLLPFNSKVNPIVALAMREKGFSVEEIAKHFSSCVSTVEQVLAKIRSFLANASVYNELENQLLAGFRQKILFSFTEEEIQKAPVGTRMMMLGIAFDKSQKLPNIPQVHDLGKEIKELKELKVDQHKLLDKLRELGIKAGITDNVIDVLPVDVKQIEHTSTERVKISVDRKRISKQAVGQYDSLMDSKPDGTEH